MPTDAELLQRYVQTHDERAFTTLVQRHLNRVYAAALRRTGGRVPVAEEITQKVFTDLARKAAALQHHPALAGWLHRSTRYAAIDAVRSEIRYRKLTESLTAMTSDPKHAEDEADWGNLRPVIDDAMDALKETDREAMLLRYFDGLSFAEVGARMNLSENAARMRTERALERLRGQLSKRRITSTAAALGLLLANQVLAKAPASLASSVATAALATAPAGILASFLSIVALKKGAAIAVAAGLTAGVAGVVWSLAQARESGGELADLQAENLRLVQALAASRENPSSDLMPGEVTPPALSPESQVEVRAKETAPPENGGHYDHGQATALNALLSYAWALDTGNAAALAKLIIFNPQAQVELERIYAKQPAAIQARYRNPQELVVHVRLVSAVLSPPPNAELLEKFVATGAGPGRVVLRKAGTKGNGWPLIQTAEGWKIELPAKGVETAVQKLLNNEIVVQLGLH